MPTQESEGQVSDVRPDPQPVCVATADWHLCHTPPAARGETRSEWYDRQADYLGQINDVAGSFGGVPVLIAGDVFDKYDNPAQLVNFTIRELNKFKSPVLAVPGQHDLPEHRYQDGHRSSYWTLVEAGAITNLTPATGKMTLANKPKRLLVYGFPWGFPVRPIPESFRRTGELQIALVHAYLWNDPDDAYPNAPESGMLIHCVKWFQGYDVVVSGDNHQHWACSTDKLNVWNCGSLMRRRSDQRDHQPRVGIVYSNGSVRPHFLDVSKDEFRDVPDDVTPENAGLDTEELIRQLRSLGDSALNFKEAVLAYCRANPVAAEARRLALSFLEDGKNETASRADR